MPHLAQGLGFDLPDPFARDSKLTADFFERPAVAIHESEAFAMEGESIRNISFRLYERTGSVDVGASALSRSSRAQPIDSGIA